MFSDCSKIGCLKYFVIVFDLFICSYVHVYVCVVHTVYENALSFSLEY